MGVRFTTSGLQDPSLAEPSLPILLQKLKRQGQNIVSIYKKVESDFP